MRQLMKVLSIMLSVPILFVTGFFATLILGEGYNIFFPDIDTRYTLQFTQKRFDSIQIGMDTATVFNIIGKPFGHNDARGSGWYDPYVKGYVWHYTGDGACKCFDFAWLEKYLIVDTNGKVVQKGETIAYD